MRIILFFLTVYSLIFAQVTGSSAIVSPISLAMGNSYVSSSRGFYSSGVNPANLVYSKNNNFEMSTIFLPPSLNIAIGNNSLQLNDVIKYFTPIDSANILKPRRITKSDISDINDLLKDNINIFSNVNSGIFKIYYHYNDIYPSFAISLDEYIMTNTIFPKKLPLSLVNLSPLQKTDDVDLSSFDLKFWWLRSYSFSMGYTLNNFNFIKELTKNINIDQIDFGLGIKYISGFAYAGFDKNSILFNHTNDTISQKYEYNISINNLSYISLSDNFGPEYDYKKISIKTHIPKQVFPKEAGRGYGFDFGLNFRFKKYHVFSFALTDVGNIKWFKNTAKYSAIGSFKYSGLGKGNISEIQDSLQRTLDTLDKFAPNDSFKSSLPTAIRIGYATQINNLIDDFPGLMFFTFDFNIGLNNMPGNSKKARISAGINWNISEYLPYVRTGFSTGGLYGFMWSLGTGFESNFYTLDFAIVNLHELLQNNKISKAIFSIGGKLRF
ncbi:MAG TPA: DUF5723 family protein [Ignavibacteriales bacterium]|nr:DUF5723 family protein [Ignavibacteriales bacterium]